MRRRKFVVLIWGLSLVLYTVGSCPPGTSVSLTGGCETCTNGTYSKQENSPQCTRCDTCRGRRSYEIKPCNATSNTQCGCQPGSYYGGYLICLKCRLCKRGQGVSQNCSASRDTVCTTCEKGKTFSSARDLKACTPCSHCPEGHIVESECTRRADTVCKREKDINNSKWTGRQSTAKPVASRASSTRVSVPSTNRPTLASRSKSIPFTNQRRMTATDPSVTDDHTYTYVLVGLGSVLALFLVVVLGICFHRRRRKRRLRRHQVSKRKHPVDAASETSISTNDGITITDNRGSLVPLMIGLKDKLLRNASCSLIQELSQHLNPDGRWKVLAGQLNFNVTQISNFGIDQNVATEKMLTEWGHRDGSTVVALHNTLIYLKWKHEARIIKQYM